MLIIVLAIISESFLSDNLPAIKQAYDLLDRYLKQDNVRRIGNPKDVQKKSVHL
jgi:hypothetical protein